MEYVTLSDSPQGVEPNLTDPKALKSVVDWLRTCSRRSSFLPDELLESLVKHRLALSFRLALNLIFSVRATKLMKADKEKKNGAKKFLLGPQCLLGGVEE